jgi:Uma2 family endonuclease
MLTWDVPQQGRMKDRPILCDGDFLNASEFHTRYLKLTEFRKVELIDGIVYMPSPVNYRNHGRCCGFLGTWLSHYFANHPELCYAPDTTFRMTPFDEVQPDFSLFRIGENVTEESSGLLLGAPELVVEVAASTITKDRGPKFRLYEKAGCLEYLLWNTDSNTIAWFFNNHGTFEEIPHDELGIFRSKTFPGLWLDGYALMQGRVTDVIATLQQGSRETQQ